MKYLKCFSLSLLFVAGLLNASLLLSAPAPKDRKVIVPNKAQLKAQPFDLKDVRLLAGPFRDAMLRDQQYLLSLDPDRLLHDFRVTAGIPSAAKPHRRM